MTKVSCPAFPIYFIRVHDAPYMVSVSTYPGVSSHDIWCRHASRVDTATVSSIHQALARAPSGSSTKRSIASATPSSSLVPTTTSATARSSGTALPMATARPTCSAMSVARHLCFGFSILKPIACSSTARSCGVNSGLWQAVVVEFARCNSTQPLQDSVDYSECGPQHAFSLESRQESWSEQPLTCRYRGSDDLQLSCSAVARPAAAAASIMWQLLHA